MTSIVIVLGGCAAIFERIKRIDFSGGQVVAKSPPSETPPPQSDKVTKVKTKNSIMLTLEMTKKSRYGSGIWQFFVQEKINKNRSIARI